MAFQIKDFASIVASIVNHARSATKKVTDWQPGSVARTLAEAPAVEIEELYLQMFLGLREAIPVATFKSFGFDKLPPAYARGFVSVSSETAISDPITVPVGGQFTTEDGRTYLCSTQTVWSSGTSVRIPVVATAAGSSFNVASGLINTSPLFNDGFSISNSLIANGRDIETDEEQEARFADFIASLSRGTIKACSYAAQQTVTLDQDGNIYEYVTRSGLTEIAGYVRIYLYSSRGIPSPELIANAQRTINGYRDEITGQIVPGYRSGGVRVDIIAMTERLVPFSAEVKTLPGYSVTSELIQDLLDAYSTALEGVAAGDTLYMDTLINEYLLAVRGVLQVIPSSNSNIVCAAYETLKPGTFAISPIS